MKGSDVPSKIQASCSVAYSMLDAAMIEANIKRLVQTTRRYPGGEGVLR